jgi:hypothetical protein
LITFISFVNQAVEVEGAPGVTFKHYTNKVFNGGYCHRFELDNSSDQVFEDWQITFETDANVYKNYSSNLVADANNYYLTGLSWNSPLKSGRDTRFGFCAKKGDVPENVQILHRYTPKEYLIFEGSFNQTWEQDWDLRDTRYWGKENLTITDNNTLKVFYPEGSYVPSAGEVGTRGGAGFIQKLNTTETDLYLSYEVFFEPGFQWVLGGKLPGLCGNTCPTGGSQVDKGFSARMMWRADGAVEIYGYFADKEDGYGASYGRGTGSVTIGKWHTIQQRIRLNTPDNSDGLIEYWIDGEKKFSQSGLFITHDAYNQDLGMMFQTFFGGSELKYATPIDTHTQFRNFRVWNQ